MIAASNPSHDVRARRIFAALLEGVDLDAIAAREQLPAKEAQAVLREALGQRWVPPLADFAKIQIARLENLYLHAMDRVDSGELAGVDRALRSIDRLDRYHGFNRASPALEPYGDADRKRLIDKLNAVAARLAVDPPASPSDT